MRLLLDECVPRRLRRELPGHEVQMVQEAGWAGVKNGALLRVADGLFDALLTVDQGVEHQQNMTGLRVGVVIMMAPSNDIDDLSGHSCLASLKRSGSCSQGRSNEWVRDVQMEPTRRCPVMKRAVRRGFLGPIGRS